MPRATRARGGTPVQASYTQAQIDSAISALNRWSIDRMLVSGMNNEQANTRRRECVEICEMVDRIRTDANKNGHGWKWNILRVLDWDNRTLEVNESKFRRSFPIPGERQTIAERKADDRLRKERRSKVAAASRAYEAACPHVEWAATRWDSHLGGLTTLAILDDFERGRAALAAAMEQVIALDDAYRKLSQIHGKVRRFHHVRAAAFVMLSDLEGLDGRSRSARLAAFIEKTNDELEPSPCPEFAGSNAHEKVRDTCRMADAVRA